VTPVRRFLDDRGLPQVLFHLALALQVFAAVEYVSGDRVLPLGELSIFLALAGGFCYGHGCVSWNSCFTAADRCSLAEAAGRRMTWAARAMKINKADAVRRRTSHRDHQYGVCSATSSSPCPMASMNGKNLPM